ncbi:MAG: serine hydroxymethyltransferase [Nannocystaceae bacterium]
MSANDPGLALADPDVHALVLGEDARQRESLRLIASENYTSRAVLEACATSLTNKYAEGYPGRRYYEGMQFVDPIETLAIDRAKALFGAEHVNVQSYSGSPANLAALLALCEPGDTIMGMSLPAGGHLTHGWRVSATGIYYNAVQYGVHPQTHRLDMDEIRALAREHRPRFIWAGHSAYPRTLDFEAFASIANEVDARVVADIAHIAGLVAAGVHPSPIPHCDATTTTTHKSLRGPRGAIIMCRQEHAKAIDKAVFPGLQGGPHNNVTAAKAVALREASTPEFRAYGRQIVDNARRLGEALICRGYTLITGGTDNHLLLIDLTNRGISGRTAAKALNRCGIELNGNSIPFDPRKPFDPSGIRVGLSALTSRGLLADHMNRIADLLDEGIGEAARCDGDVSDAFASTLHAKIREFLAPFAAPGI